MFQTVAVVVAAHTKEVLTCFNSQDLQTRAGGGREIKVDLMVCKKKVLWTASWTALAEKQQFTTLADSKKQAVQEPCF